MSSNRRRLLLAILTGAMLSGTGVQTKRSPPKEIPPVLAGGVRYTVPHAGALHGKTQDGGYVQAWDARTKKLLWDRMVYRVRYVADREKDVQDVFITEIRIEGGRLIVKNARSERFEMDLASGRVRALTGLGPQTETPAVPERP